MRVYGLMRATWIMPLTVMLTWLVGSSSASSVANVRGVPLDLYLLLDQSGSISTPDWKKIVNFGDQLRLNLADKIGYYEEGGGNGLRVCLITFVCRRGDNIFTRIRFEPTGNTSVMEEKFDRLLTLTTGGETCMASALKSVDKFIGKSSALEPPLRKSVLLFLTDGRFDDFGSSTFQSSLSSIQASPRSATFAVGIGNTDQSQLRSAAGGKDNVFQVEDANSLTEITSTLTAFIFGDFAAQLARKADISLVDGNEDVACIGEDLVVVLTGETIFSLDPDTQQIDCDMTFPGAAEPETSNAALVNGLWLCDVPPLYTPLDTNNIVLAVYTRNQGEPLSARRKIRETTFGLNLAFCVSIAPGLAPCLGSTGNISISGETLQTLGSNPGATIECVFSSQGFSGELSSIGSAENCPLPSITADWVAAQTSESSSPRQFDKLEVRLTVPGSIDSVEVANADFQPSNPSLCAAPSLTNSPVCFADTNSLKWTGPSVAWGLTQMGWTLTCLITHNGEKTEIAATQVDNGAADTVECNLAAEEFSMTGVAEALEVELALVHPSPERKIPLAPSSPLTNDIELCGGLVPLAASICLGEEARARVEVLNNAAVGYFSAGRITCRFIDVENDVQFDSTAQAESDGTFICLGEEFSQESFGVRYDVLQLHFEGFRVAEFPLDVESDACFLYEARIQEDEPWQVVSESQSFDVCYGRNTSNAQARISGRSAAGLIQANVSVACRFASSLTIVAEPVDNMGQNHLLCPLPASVLDLDESTIEVIVRQDTIADKHNIRTTVGGRPPCVTSKVRASTNAALPLCLGSELEAAFHGETISHILSLLLSDQISRIRCIFADETSTDAYAIESDGLACQLPIPLSQRLGEVTAETMSFSLQGNGGEIESVLSGFTTVAQGDPECLRATHSLTRFDGSTETNPESLCAGEVLHTWFDGTTVRNITAEDLSCVYASTDRTTVITVASIFDGSRISCELPQWSPFSVESRAVLEITSLSLLLTTTNESIYDTALPSSSVCMSVASHGIDESLRPTAGANNRLLVQDCWPSCCRRSQVEIGFEGESIRLFASQPQRIRCAYISSEFELGVNPSTNAVELVPSVFYSSANLAGNRLSCGAVQGWKLNSSSGDYKSVVVQVLTEDLAEVDAEVHTFEYPVSTASTTCIHLVYSPQMCLGRREEYPLAGVTLLALFDEFQALTAVTSCEKDRRGLNVSRSGPQTLMCSAGNDRVLVPQTFPATRLDLRVNGVDLFSQTISPVTFASTPDCLMATEAARICQDPTNSSVNLVATGSILASFPREEILCRFIESNGVDDVVVSPTWQLDGTLQCQFGPSREKFTGFVISGLGASLLQGSLQGVNCPDEGGSEGLSVGGIAAIAVGSAGIAASALICLCCCMKQRKKQEDKEKEPSVADGMNSPEESPLGTNLFRKGERVEGRLGYTMDPERNDWYKGTIERVVEGLGGALYHIVYDDPSLGKEENITQAALRTPNTDFRVGQKVQAQVKRDQDKWLVAEIHSVRKNDCYHVKFSGDKEDELDLPGDLIRNAQTLPTFDIGDIVSVASRRGVIQDVHCGNPAESILYTVILSEDGNGKETKENVPESSISLWRFAVGDTVHVQDLTDPKLMRQGTIRSISNQNTYSVQHDDDRVGAEEGVAISRLFRPVFKVGTLVDVRDTITDKWVPAVVEEHLGEGRYKLREEDAKNEFIVGVDRMRLRLSNGAEEEVEPQEEESHVWRPPARHVDLDALPDGPGTKPKHLRFKRKKPLAYRDLPNNQFEVTLDMSEGLGVSLGWTKDDKVIVAGFKDLTNGDWGPVEACGLVGLKDMLLEVNGKDIQGCTFREVSDIIHEAAGQPIVLRFGRYTGEGPTRKTLMNEQPNTREKESGIRIPSFVDENNHTNITET